MVEEIDTIVNTCCENLLKDKSYEEHLVPQWIDRICEESMTGLSELGKPFKYIVTAVIMQKTGAGIHSAAACFDHPETDGMYTVKWPPDKHKDHNRYLMCIVTVFGLSLSG